MARWKLVVAVGPHFRDRVARALAGSYELVFVDDVAQATREVEAADRGLAGVVCSVHFDESRMFDVLEHLRGRRALEGVPFIAVQFETRTTALTASSRRSLEILRAALAEIHDLPMEEGDRHLLATVQRAAPSNEK